MPRKRRIKYSGSRWRAANRKRDGHIAKIAKKVVLKAAETKLQNIQFTNNNDPLNGVSAIQLLTLIDDGDDGYSREGNKITLNSIGYRWRIDGDATPTTDTIIRIIIGIYGQIENETLPTVASILALDDVAAPNNWDEHGKFRILSDKTRIILKKDTVAHVGKITMKYYKKFNRGVKCSYSAAGATINQAKKNHLFMIRMCDQPNLSQAMWNGNVRVTFKDL